MEPARWKNREAPCWMDLQNGHEVAQWGWRGSQRARGLVKSAVNEGCDPGGSGWPYHKDGGERQSHSA